MVDQGHHSIGEVLSLLKDEFPDITISKIRFLESQGLIDPERTPSGYRKFYSADIERLRWILVQQRDHFLPLKVMKQRIQEAGFDPVADRDDDETPAPVPEPTIFSSRRSQGDDAESDEGDEPEETPVAEPDDTEADVGVAPESRPDKPLDQPAGSVSLTATEVATAADVDAQLLSDLIRFGIIVGRDVEGETVFDHDALVVARAAAALSRRGLEARHLRMFKVSAEREAGVFEQLLAPMARRADGSAQTEMNELVELGETIHRAILRRLLGPQLG